MMKKKPNILFAFADDWGRYASCYQGIPGASALCDFVNTPNIDRIAREGVLFANAHVPAPSCTPCRSSVLSGRYFWQTRLGAILAGAVFDRSIPTYPVLLQEAGYDVGFMYKVWGPGVALGDPYAGDNNKFTGHGVRFNQFSFVATENMTKGMSREDAKEPLYDEVRGNFSDFLSRRQANAKDGLPPFCFWWGPTNTHREWQKGSGKALWGIDPDALEGNMPAFFPDVPEVREDVADYLGEAMAFDRGLGVFLEMLKEAGELDNTLVVVSGDHGMPGFPRAKCNLYDIGSEVALLASLPGTIPGNRVVLDQVNIMSLAPTFLDIAGVDKPDGMVAESLLPKLTSPASGLLQEEDNWAITGRERHVAHARQWNLPYPTRALRTADYTYIRNFKPDRWPSGDPKGMDDPQAPTPPWDRLEHDNYTAYSDVDASPTKAWMVNHRAEEEHRENYRLGFDKRPLEELYHNTAAPDQMQNLADDPAYHEIKRELRAILLRELSVQDDPRVVEPEAECRFEHSPYTDTAQNGPNHKETLAMSAMRWSMS